MTAAAITGHRTFRGPSGRCTALTGHSPGLGDGADHARRVGVRGAATGHRATPTGTGADCSLRQG